MKSSIAAVLFALIFSACGSLTASPSSVTATGAVANSTVAPASTSTSSSATPATSTVAKVSANNATNDQLIAAFTAAGISNPSSWAREVQEYRPYDTSDSNLTKLRQNLVKYNPAASVVDKIVATLSLP